MGTQISLLKSFRKQQWKRKSHRGEAKNKILLMNISQSNKPNYPSKPTNPAKLKTSRKTLEKQSCASSRRTNQWFSNSSRAMATTTRSSTWCWTPTRTKSTPSHSSDPFGWTNKTNSQRNSEFCRVCTSASTTWGTFLIRGWRIMQSI